MARRRLVLTGVLAALLVLAAGTAALWCWATRPERIPTGPETWPARPASLPTPEIIWPDGLPDDGQWADDEWVQAFRAADLSMRVARNAHDFSGADVADQVGERDLKEAANTQHGFANGNWRYGDTTEFKYSPGPWPVQILGVEVRDTGTFIAICHPETWAVPRASEVQRPDEFSTFRTTVVRMERRDDRIVRANEEHWGPPFDVPRFFLSQCDPTQIRAGYFTTDPLYEQPFEPWDVIGPDGNPMSPPPHAPAAHATGPSPASGVEGG